MMSSLFSLCLVLLITLSMVILLSLRQAPPSSLQEDTVGEYLANYTVHSSIIEKQLNRNGSGGREERRRKLVRERNMKFDKMVREMKREEDKGDNKYFRRNDKIHEIFSKRLGIIKEYCERYKKGQKRGIRGIKPRAATKSFSLGEQSSSKYIITSSTRAEEPADYL